MLLPSQESADRRLPTLLERRPLISRANDQKWKASDLPEEFRDISPFGGVSIVDSGESSQASCSASDGLREFLGHAFPYAAIVSVTVAIAMMLLPGWPWPGCNGVVECDCPVAAYWCIELATLVSGIAAAFLLDNQAKMANKSHVRSAGYYAVSNWIAGITLVAAPNIGGPSCVALGWSSRETLISVFVGLRSLFWLLGQLWMQQLVLSRITALEEASLRQLGGALMRKNMYFQLASMVLMCLFMPYVPHDCLEGRWFAMLYAEPLKSLPSLLAAGLIVSSTLFSFAVSFLAVKSLLAVVSLLREARRATDSSQVPGRVNADVCQALACAQRQLGGVVACLAMMFTIWTAFAIWSASPSPATEALNTATQSLDTVVHALAAIFLTGGHTAKTPSVVRKLREGTFRPGDRSSDCITKMQECLKPIGEQTGTGMGQDWDNKVEDLAHRAITLDALLNFYRRLGNDVMPHYASDLHSTHDVVRQAIIPLTRAERSDGAHLVMRGKRMLPDCMVTHAWSNCFRDLVACVVAHVLQECSYQLVLELLDEDISVLENMLEQAEKLQYSVWICAFAVNQHLSICASPPSTPDPVSGLVLAPCDCGLPKFFNSDGMLAPDGRSVECEMNKFDEVMMYFAKTQQNFVQCIAIDADFKVFSRAWCIAEAVEAGRLGIKQSLVVPSRQKLMANTPNLLSLRVEDMQASFQEDKDLILAKIVDKSAFNRQLQKLIFDRHSGLLAVWHNLDTEEQMSLVGRLLRWQGADNGEGIVWRHWEP